MLAVLFEVELNKKGEQAYFELAAQLKEKLLDIDGFISVERFESLTQKGRYLSLSYWRDEKAVKQWRNLAQHREAQKQGRNELFERYTIRVAEVVRCYDMTHRDAAPKD